MGVAAIERVSRDNTSTDPTVRAPLTYERTTCKNTA